MRTSLYSAVTTVLLISGAAHAAESIPLTAVNKANEVIDAAIEAYGGADKLSNLKTIFRKSNFHTWATYQSKRPGPPWDQNNTESWAAVNFADEQFRNWNTGSGGGFDFTGGQLINGENSYAFDFRAGTMTEVASPDFNNSSGPFTRVTAPLLVKQLQNRRGTSHWLGEVDFEGRTHDVVTLVMEVGPALALYFDRETHLLSRSERVLPPYGQVDYRFRDYVTVDGIPFAENFELYVNDQPNLVSQRETPTVNMDFEQFAVLPGGLEIVGAPPSPPTEIELQEISEGVFLVGGNGTYVMFIEMEDYVISVGGTAGVPERIKALRDVIKDKPIRYGVLTHHHVDHLVGVRAYEAEGIEIITMKAHEEAVRHNAVNGESLKLRFVDGEATLNGGSRSVELHDIGPTPHSEHLLVAYLPDEKILFEADHFPNPGNGRFQPAQPVTQHLAKALAERGLEVETILGAHTPWMATMDDLARALALKPKKLASSETPAGSASSL